MKELSAAEYLEACDILEAQKERIKLFDLQARFNSLKSSAFARTTEAIIAVSFGTDKERLDAMRSGIAERMKAIDRKYGRKYWEGLAQQVGIVWRADD